MYLTERSRHPMFVPKSRRTFMMRVDRRVNDHPVLSRKVTSTRQAPSLFKKTTGHDMRSDCWVRTDRRIQIEPSPCGWDRVNV
jgi:hypothetical protein